MAADSHRTHRRRRPLHGSPLYMSAVDDRVKAAMDLESSLEQDEYRPTALMANVKDVGRPFPMSMVIGNDMVKTALLLAAVNPAMGGVVISGRRGTCKSVLARALHRLLPPIERVKDSAYNLDPEAPDQMDSFTLSELEASGKEFAELEREICEAPFVQVSGAQCKSFEASCASVGR